MTWNTCAMSSHWAALPHLAEAYAGTIDRQGRGPAIAKFGLACRRHGRGRPAGYPPATWLGLLLSSAGSSTTRNWPIIPLSSCSMMWQ